MSTIVVTQHPDAVLLSRAEVAKRLGWSEAKLDRARNSVDPSSDPPPMPGWKRTGPESRPSYRLPESALIAYIESLPDA